MTRLDHAVAGPVALVRPVYSLLACSRMESALLIALHAMVDLSAGRTSKTFRMDEGKGG